MGEQLVDDGVYGASRRHHQHDAAGALQRGDEVGDRVEGDDVGAVASPAANSSVTEVVRL